MDIMDIEKFVESERELSKAYLRLRTKLSRYGALDTKYGGVDRFQKTEEALDLALSHIKTLESQLNRIQDITNE